MQTDFDEFRRQIVEFGMLLEGMQHQNPRFVLDGPIDLDRYLESTLRILWILREPHDDGSEGPLDCTRPVNPVLARGVDSQPC